MDLGLGGKVVVVTGASRGIGLAVAGAFAEEGASVVTGSRSANDDLKKLVGRYSVVPVEVDLGSAEGPGELVRRAVEEFGGVDILINNVGLFEPRLAGFASITDEDWQRTLDLNLMSAVRASRAALPVMVGRGGGAIVNVSSINARLPQSPVADYAASKAAMTNLSKLLAEEYGPQGVRVNTVSPGPVRTSAWQDEGSVGDGLATAMGAELSAFLEGFAGQAGISLGRMGEPDEVASLVLFLASDRMAGWTSGSDYVIDGGMLKVA